MPGEKSQRPAAAATGTASGTRVALAAFGAIFATLWVLHLPLLRLPYFWDEAGYFIPAARDLLRTGDLIAHSTLSNAHPPLVMVWLALCWKLTTFSVLVTRTAMLLVASFGLTALWLLGRRVAGSAAATAAVLLTALSPTVFSQSAMAQLDIAAFALVLWTIYTYVCGRRWQTIAFAALAGVAKETTVAVTLTLAGVDALSWIVHRWYPERAARMRLPRPTLAQCASYGLAVLPLVSWYAYHFHRTGHVFGNPDYLRYNVGATVTPWRILIAAGMRLWHVTGYMNLFVLTAPALLLAWSMRQGGDGKTGNAALPAACARALPAADAWALPAAGASAIPAEIRWLLLLVVLAQVAEFSIVGGALLARYMIPALPLVILLAVEMLRRYAPRWQWWVAGCAAAFVAALLFNPPWSIAPEDNLTWARFVEMHEHAAHYVEQHYAGAQDGTQRVLTAWPASDELNRPYLGYVDRPLTVVRVENFTAEEVLRAAQQTENFDVVVAFSTKLEPPRRLLPRIAFWSRAQTRYFDYHQDLPAAAIARLLHGRIVWSEASPGEWIAVIEIEKIRNARR